MQELNVVFNFEAMETDKDSKELIAQKRCKANNDDGDDFVAIKQPKLENVFENKERLQSFNKAQTKVQFNESEENATASSKARISKSPKKRLHLPANDDKRKEKFIYGNYSQYYGYRNKDFQDVRLDVFETRREIFADKHILDIGCNNGFITTAVAKRLNVKSIVGIDIDRTLINQAIKNLTKAKKALPMDNEARRLGQFPYNVHFVSGNYVLKDDVLLEIERQKFDLILCLSITKWIQLNFGDAGLKQAFRRMFLQLRSGGILILEAQPLKNYRKRKYVSDDARLYFKEMKFFPKQFTDYLLSDEIGFERTELLGVPEHCVEGFKRPIQIFYKE